MNTAQPTCSEGIAANWLAMESGSGLSYTAGPYTTPVSIISVVPKRRGGARGTSRCRTRAAPVSQVSTQRTQR